MTATPQPPSPSTLSRFTSGLALKVLLPVALGLGVVVWLFARDFNPAALRELTFTPRSILFLLLAWVFAAGRDWGLAMRLRVMTDGALRRTACWRVTLLCEFVSAITPSTVGGSALGMVFLHREGLPWGRSTTLMMATVFLDELFFVAVAPLAVAILGAGALFGFAHEMFSMGIRTVFWIVYGLIALWTAILFVGIIARPQVVKRLIDKIFSLRWLRRRRSGALEFTANMEATGHALRSRPAAWWLRAMGATALSWFSRFLVVNMLFAAFLPGASQAVVLGRQIVVWLLLAVSPTPGGSGVSEWLFTEYYGDLIGSAGLALVIALCWRVVSYYVYLAIGAVMLPSWLRRRPAPRSPR